MLFANESLMMEFERADDSSFDGTFYVCPSLFKQLFIIMYKKDKHFFPGFVAPLTGKSFDHYLSLFLAIQELVPNFNPLRFMSDFERASRNAAKRVWGNGRDLETKGCFFHFCQSILKHIRILGLFLKFSRVKNFRKWVMRVMALPLLPADQIHPTWDQLKAQIFNFNVADLENFQKFKDYVQAQWINGTDQDDLSVHGQRDATNNFSESFNAILKKEIKTKQPNVWFFLLTMNNILADKALDSSRLSDGLPIVRDRGLATEENIQRRRDAENRLANGEITSIEFLDLVLHSFQGYVNDVRVDYQRRLFQIDDAEAVEVAAEDPDANDLENDPGDNNQRRCCVCLNNYEATWICMPCRHGGACQNCLSTIVDRHDNCPICREPIETIMRVFMNP